jgi:hypothetical protein
MWQPPMGISDERNGYPLMVPFTGTRPLVPNLSRTSIGGVIADTAPASFPSIFTRNRSFFCAIENLFASAGKLYL